MRQLMRRRAARALARGLTLIEMMATLAISAILLGMAAPYLYDMLANGQLREGGNTLLSETLYAQGEAIKRNATTRIRFDGNQIEVRDMSQTADGVVLRQRVLGQGLSVAANVTISFSSRGTTLPLGADAEVDIVRSGLVCTAEMRCPGLRVDGGGGVRLCPDKLNCS